MLPKDTSILSLLVALVIAGVLGTSGYNSYQVMHQKSLEQIQAVEDFRKWKADYTSLLPVDERWKASFHSVNDAKDLLSLYGLVGSDSDINPDKLIVEKMESLKMGESALGATRVCMGSTLGNGVLLEATDFTKLLTGLEGFAQRPDIQMGAVHLTQEKGKAKATVSGFCLLLRDAEGGQK